MHQTFSESQSQEHRQDKTRQLFMGVDSLQISQSGKGSRGDDEECRKIAGVSSQLLFNMAFSIKGESPDVLSLLMEMS